MDHKDLLFEITGKIKVSETLIQEIREDVREIKLLIITEQKRLNNNIITTDRVKRGHGNIVKALWILATVLCTSVAGIIVKLLT